MLSAADGARGQTLRHWRIEQNPHLGAASRLQLLLVAAGQQLAAAQRGVQRGQQPVREPAAGGSQQLQLGTQLRADRVRVVLGKINILPE